MRSAGRRAPAARRGGAAASPNLRLLRGPDPAVLLGATDAWAADDVTVAATAVARWNPYVGATQLASIVGVAQAAPVAQAALGGRLGVTHTGTGYYTGLLSAAGASQTLCFIGRMANVNVGLCALTNAGAINTGSSIYSFAGNTTAQRPSFVSATYAQAFPVAGVWMATFTTAGCSLYYNGGTAVAASAVASTAFNFATFSLGGLDASGANFALNGAACRAAVFDRVLTAAEITLAMKTWCARYGQVFTP